MNDCGATISDCGTYRYHLWRVWNDEAPTMVFVMLNPSTADADKDDPTIRRCIGFARREGFGSISVRNVFALRATDPEELLTHPDPVGPENDKAMLAARSVMLMSRLVVAWGSRIKSPRLKTHYQNAAMICQIQEPYCLGTTKSGDPRHPLYVHGETPLRRWSHAEMKL